MQLMRYTVKINAVWIAESLYFKKIHAHNFMYCILNASFYDYKYNCSIRRRKIPTQKILHRIEYSKFIARFHSKIEKLQANLYLMSTNYFGHFIHQICTTNEYMTAEWTFSKFIEKIFILVHSKFFYHSWVYV